MERGLALALFVLMSLGVVTIKLLSRSGVVDLRTEWHRYIADHTSAWLMLLPFVYAALCEIARGKQSPRIVLTLTRALGFVLLAVFAYCFASVIFDF